MRMATMLSPKTRKTTAKAFLALARRHQDEFVTAGSFNLRI